MQFSSGSQPTLDRAGSCVYLHEAASMRELSMSGAHGHERLTCILRNASTGVLWRGTLFNICGCPRAVVVHRLSL